MAEGILGLGTSQSTVLDQKLIDKLKKAETKARVEPLENSLKNLNLENQSFNVVKLRLNELFESIKPFDFFVKGGVNVFAQKVASTSGSSALFNTLDASKLNNGTTNVDIKKLAQKDVYQSKILTSKDKDSIISKGELNIKVGTQSFSFDTTNKKYSELIGEINKSDKVFASLEQVGDTSYRLVIKSVGTGEKNSLTITGEGSESLGYTTNGVTKKEESHILTAQNMQALIDGVSYENSTNSVVIGGSLRITAVALGKSSADISDDISIMTKQISTFVNKYNTFVTTLEQELAKEDSYISDRTSLRTLLSNIKARVLGEYGDNKSLFSYGFEINKQGELSFDNQKLENAIGNDIKGFKDLFIGKAESKGLGTQLNEYLTNANLSSGVVGRYEIFLENRKETLTENKDKAIKNLDDKYTRLEKRFAEYTAIISRMERSFSGLKLMIEQSQKSS